MVSDAGDDAGVSGHLVVPPSSAGIVLQLDFVGELGLQGRGEFGAGDVVVTLFADVGVGAGFRGQVAGGVSVGDPGFEHL